jgi:hypothetical protein
MRDAWIPAAPPGRSKPVETSSRPATPSLVAPAVKSLLHLRAAGLETGRSGGHLPCLRSGAPQSWDLAPQCEARPAANAALDLSGPRPLVTVRAGLHVAESRAHSQRRRTPDLRRQTRVRSTLRRISGQRPPEHGGSAERFRRSAVGGFGRSQPWRSVSLGTRDGTTDASPRSPLASATGRGVDVDGDTLAGLPRERTPASNR